MYSHKKELKHMPEKKYLTKDDVSRLKDASKSSDDRLVIAELARTGTSVNEIKKAKGPILEPRI